MPKESVLKKIASYTTLAAAGLAAEPAVAGVITSGPGFTPVTIAPGETKGISFGPGIGNVFQFAGSIQSFINSSSSTIVSLSAVIQRGFSATGTASVLRQGLFYANDPARLGAGYLIGGLNPFIAAGNSTTQDVGGNVGSWNGSYGTPVRGFLGIRFTSPGLSGGLHYGFFDVGYDNNGSNGVMTVYGWAFEDVTDAPISTPGAVPEPATMIPAGLGMLALGAAGIRRKRAQSAE